MSAPLHSTDTELGRLGYNVIADSGPSRRFRLQANEASRGLERDATDMKAKRWFQLTDLIQRQVSTISELGKMAASPDYSAGIAVTSIDEVLGNKARLEILSSLDQKARDTVSCIQYFSSSFSNSGLKPVRAGQDFIWSAEDLKRVFNVADLDQADEAQKAKIRQQIQDYAAKTLEFDYACITPDQGAFFAREQAKLGKE